MKGRELQQDFLGKMDWQGTFGSLLDLLPDVAFFMKDLEGRFVMHNRRANAACQLLETTDLTVTAIALETGLFDPSHLIRIFRRIMNVTPGEYRHLHTPKP